MPTLQQVLENIGRSLTAAQVSVAGHAVETFENPAERQRLLGLPMGKTAFRDVTDYLRTALRIDGTEARRRIRWAAALRPAQALSGAVLPARLPLLSEAVQDGAVDRVAVDVITQAVETARQMARRVGADPQTVGPLLEDGEERLVSQSLSVDPGTLRKVSNHWLSWFEATVDPDGAEPNDADLPQMQGMIRQGKRNGLHHWLLAVNDVQNEYLETIVGAATNPRATYRGQAASGESAQPAGSGDSVESGRPAEAGVPGDWSAGRLTAEVLSEGSSGLPDGADEFTAVPALDPRSRNQQQLDGLIACIAGGLTLIESDRLPSSGGQRPQVAVTIDYHTLLGDLEKAGTLSAEDLSQFESSAAFTGTVHPNTIRAMACDADILPVVLGSQGEVLDVGRAQRLFPTRLRQAIAARDGGCTAPGCWIPAPWCEAHHVEHWEHGGPTSVENGVLLCVHHHHAVHSGAWDIDMRSGSPWFIPAPYLDPRRQPQRNLYWRQR
ncbi:HNH endonuclease signature motif containing protein [Citricoccus nitrophenolicus]|uniref:HNH endonuclease signature motif containing protein n=1 Tax=Citricoccus nitrophenolicus TaxID=863575 RepID=UPI0031E618A4